MNQWLAIISLFIGASFSLIASIGITTMPDLFTRMQTSTKSSTFGVAFIFLAAAFYFANDLGIVIRALLIALFVFATAPIAGHMIGRAAYSRQVPLWEGSVIDELAGNYDRMTHTSKPPERFKRASESESSDVSLAQ